MKKELQFRPLTETISIYETEKTIVLVVYQLERVFPTNEKNNEGTPNLRMVGSTLVNIIEKPSRATIGEIDSGSIERIWSNLMNHLRLRHRINARNGYSTDYKIEDLRIDHYGAYQDPEYFRRHVAELATRHSEIQVEGNIIRLTPECLHYCETDIPGWQRDF